MNRIGKDIGFRLVPWYQHNLRYSFSGEYHSTLNLTYKDNYIYDIKAENDQSLLLSQLSYWESNLYLSFQLIPHVGNDISSLILNNLYFVRMQLDYVWTYGYVGYHDHDYEQFLLLDVNLDIVLIFVKFEVFID